MLPTLENLRNYHNKEFKLEHKAKNSPEIISKQGLCAKIQVDDKGITIGACNADKEHKGLWVPYASQKAIWGVAESGEKWAGSGPFSGCILEVGLNNKKPYIAHLAQESGSNAVSAWNKERSKNECTKRQSWKVSFSETYKDTWPATHVFLNWKNGLDNLDIVVVFVKTESMGGINGKILEVWNPLNKTPSKYASFEVVK